MATTDRKLLVVSEERFIQRYFEVLFKAHTVLGAGSAAAAAEVLDRHCDIQVVVSDEVAQLADLLARIRKEHPRIVQVVLTGHAPADALQALKDRAGVFRFVFKPFSNPELLHTIQQALEFHDLQEERRRPEGQDHESAAAVEHRVQHRLDQLEEQNRQLIEVSELKDEMVMVAAHDLRAPLSVMVGYATILAESEHSLSAEGRQMLSRIHFTGTRLLNMVHNILSLAALKDGKDTLHCRETRMRELIHAVVETLRGRLESKRLDFSLRIAGSDEPILVDGIKLERVLQNLLSNAIAYTPEGGRVALECQVTPELVTVKVRDTGCGLTPDQVEHAFERFVRFGTNMAPGSGLGLAIVKGFVEMHGGAVAVESAPGKGSTFTITIVPAQPERVGRARSGD